MFVYQMWPQMKLNYRNIIIIIIIIICSYFKQVLLTTAVKVVDSVYWYVINIYEIWAVWLFKWFYFFFISVSVSIWRNCRYHQSRYLVLLRRAHTKERERATSCASSNHFQSGSPVMMLTGSLSGLPLAGASLKERPHTCCTFSPLLNVCGKWGCWNMFL